MFLHVLRAAVFVAVFFTSLLAYAAAPTATTSAATSLTTSSAILNGGGVPNGEATTGWYRISSTNPGTCNDTFGTRVPATVGTDLGTGAASVPYSITTTGLTSGVTYYFCAIVSNGSGTAFGSVLSFLVPSVPVVSTQAPTSVGSSTATLQGTANPGASSSSGWFRYSTTNPGSCDDLFGTRAPTSGGSALGSGTSAVAYSYAVTGLLPGTTYYGCAIASNAYGTSFGSVVSFTTSPIAPAVTTNSATLVTGSTAQLNGSANPGGDVTTGWFRYSTTSPGTCNDTFGSRAPATGGTLLGSGNTAVAYSLGITGLSPATTYYFCAIAQNSVGTSFGSVLSFTTPSQPTVSTSAASSITSTTAYLNGSANPQGSSTTGYFRYSLTNPGACNDTFGSRAPTSGGSALGSGTSVQAYQQYVTGLSAGTLYYFCAIAANAEGTGFGAVLTFTTASAPTVVTSAATLVTASSATLNGSANPNGASATGWFRYAASDPGSCNDTFGTRLPSSSYYDSSLGSGTSSVAYAQGATGLTPATTYYYCAISYNTYGNGYGAVLTFTTPPALPVVSTSGATLLTGTTAQLNGSVNPGGAATTGWFRYATSSPGTCNDSFGTRAPASGGTSLGSGTTSTASLQGVTGLTAGTTYYFCAIAQNSVGTAFGSVVSFVTPTPPTVTTTAASSITNTAAYLNGSGTPNGSATTGYFRYSTTSPGTCNDTFGSRAPATGGTNLGSGTSAVSFQQYISGLSTGATYYYCAIDTSAEGTAFGAVLSFVTTGAPSVITTAATLVTPTTATLNGTANPDGASTTAWFRYATTSPGTCNDTFGTRLPSSSYYDSSLGAGTSSLAYSQAATGLTPATTYYYCAIAYNTYGNGFGSVLSFTTPAALPVVSTNSASLLTGTTAQLNASVNPGGAATTGWFRYATSSPGTCNDTFGTRAPATGGTSLGSGTTSTASLQGLTGLTAGTTYYFCAIAQNSVGTAFGSVVSFVTPTPPLVTTTAASSITNTAAYLNGSGTPNGSTTTGYFRYATTSPGACNDTFGSRAPATGGTNLGSGISAVSFQQYVSGLSVGTTYYYCAIAQSAEGTAFGALLSFTTAGVPSVTTSAATLVTASSATLNGSANPNGASTTAWYRFATSDPGSCNDTFGTRLPSSSYYDSSLGSGTSSVAYAQAATGLTPGTTYYYCAIAYNTYGNGFGAVLTFTTPAALPVVNTNSATLLTGTTAQLNASVNPGGAATTGWFRYATSSPGSCNDTFGTRAPTSGGSSLGSGTTSTALLQGITGLTAGTTYYFCAIAQNSVGTAFGSVVSFVTPTPPTVTTTAASSITNTAAYLNGSGTPNGSATTGYFRYSTTSPGTCNDTFGSRAPATGGTSLGAGTSAVSFQQYISGLSTGATYYYCAIDTSAEGMAFGAVLSFVTTGAPAVTTNAATVVTSTTATLNGTANPDGASTTAWFRYATTSPGTCNDTFGTRLPSSSYYDSSLGAGTSGVAYAQGATGLTPGATYYYCAIAYNTYGYGYGSVLSFTTPAALPVVTTNGATLLTGTTAQLNASVNPGGAATTGWFRYATISPGTCNDTFGARAPLSGGMSLGSGTTSTASLQGLTGLTAGTTYYYCAIAQNSVGTAFGSVVSFVTPTPPLVTTSAASSITNTTAYLNGSGTPNGSATTGYFRYGLTNPGTCDDTFGSRAPTTGGTALGSGTTAQSFQQYLSGMSPATTYYYCAIAQSAEGFAFGAVLSFTTATAPSVTTNAATLVTSSSATLNGAANPNGDYAYGYFRYSTSNPVVCNDTFGTRVPSSSSSDTGLGAGSTGVAYTGAISGLTPGMTYYFCALARNNYGTSFGVVLSFTAQVTKPSVTTNAATSIATTTATLNGSANPNGDNTTGWFRYATASPGTCNDTFGTRAPLSGGSPLGTGTTAVSYSQGVTGLVPGTTYYYCAIAQNAVGLSFGAVVSFTTTIAPTVSTLAATPVTATAATLNASVNPNGYTTTGWFRYSTTNPGACDNVFGTATATSALGSGTTLVALIQPITGLTPASTYYFCAIAQSSIGTSFGALLSFTTPAAPPSVTTQAASSLAATGATLNATGNPNGSGTTGWFRYSATNPGSCNDTFGTRAPLSGGSDLGPGNSPVPYTAVLTGLTSGTTYYFCALASSAIGNSVGTVLSFTTATAPTVTTTAATSVASSGATLNGSANPNQAATNAWFRYSTTSPGACNDTFGTRAPLSGGTALGSGGTAVAFSQALTGLASGTTYYFCAIADNGVGTSFGAVLSFATTAVPAVTTLAATGVTGTGATINASANPNLLTATGWLRYSATDPGACNDTFGTRAPASGGTALGSGSTAVSYSQTLTGLTAGTTYYFCALASNTAGTGYGAVLSFTTAAAPAVTTVAATSVTNTGATINGSANPNLLSTTGWLRYSTTSPGTCNDTFGTRAPLTGGSALGSGTSAVAYSQALTGLAQGTTYYYCAIAQNSVGTAFGAVLSFSTTAPPAVTTTAATSVADVGATLNGAANPSQLATTGWFRYATTNPGTCNDTFGTRAPSSGGTSLGSGGTAVAFSQALTGLTAGTTYYFCAIAQNSVGTSVGAVLSFTTSAGPAVTTAAATSVASTGATLNGSANPNLSATTGWFRYSATNPGACDDTFGTRAPASGGASIGSGSTAVAFSQALTGLTSGTTYYYCAIASNAVGTSFGAVLSFSTTSAPSVTSAAATSVTTTGATLNGAANPNLLTATGWFRYSATDPGACNDTFGTRSPAAGGSALGAGSSAVAYAQALTGLTSGTTYYYCAIASNAVGTGFGSVLSFTTAAAPSVITTAAAPVLTTSATLNGTANPNQLATTGWFRYSLTNPGACNDTFGTRSPSSGGTALGAGSTPAPYSQVLTGLTSGATYYYCAIASNSAGTGLGSVLTFTTSAAPAVTTTAPSGVAGTGATLNGSANPNLSATTGWFRYSTIDPGTCNDTFGTRAPLTGGSTLGSGGSAVAYAQAITALTQGTTYFFCAIAQSSGGTAFGAVLSFTTPAAPSVVSSAATLVTVTSATLNGVANPNLSPTVGWLRYAATDPGTCNDTFGTRVPAAGGTALGFGALAVPFSQALTGLGAASTYYFCAIAQNAEGTSFGAVLSFTTPAAGAGTPCVTAATCSTGFCVDGVCCGSACTGLCNACTTAKKGSGADGVCGPIALGTDPDNECSAQPASTCGTNGQCDGAGACQLFASGTACGASLCQGSSLVPQVCNGSGTCGASGAGANCAPYNCSAGACQTTCAGSGDCAAGYVCVGSTCQAPKVDGAACGAGNECSSTFCVDGVCCGSACTGLCNACTASKKGSGSDGTCGPIAAGADPDNECAAQAQNSCGQTGSCNGSGACQLFASGTPCGSSLCQGSVLKTQTCDGSGTCATNGSVDCAPYACSVGACKNPCAGNSDCVTGFICSAGACQPPAANGAVCTTGSQCQSGNCVDGVCCNSACTGLCQACTTAKKGTGADGTCGPIGTGLDPDNECATQAPASCGTTGFCDGAGACQRYPTGTACGSTSCQGNTVKGQICDGNGTCSSSSGTDCAPYICSTGACKNPCTTSSDCQSGNFCSAGACKPVGTAGMPCAAAAECGSGFCVDGVCCDTACTGACSACSASAKGQGADGTCDVVKAGGDPHDDCSAQAPSTCQKSGLCNGNGACGLYVAGTECAPSACNGTSAKAAAICDGLGVCLAGATKVCDDGYTCVNGACTTSCTDNTSCAPGYECDTSFNGCVATVVDGGTGGTGGTGGSTGSTTGTGTGNAGGGGAGGNTSTGGTGGTTTSTKTGTGTEPSGCGCTVPGDDDDGRQGSAAAVLALAALAVMKRRRRAADVTKRP
jgi:MYXO-CTERM domain-containing protein